MRPMAGSGANPMVPKNGRSIGTTTPFATSAVLVSRLSGMIRVQTPVNSSGRAPV